MDVHLPLELVYLYTASAVAFELALVTNVTLAFLHSRRAMLISGTSIENSGSLAAQTTKITEAE